VAAHHGPRHEPGLLLEGLGKEVSGTV
jgi:hypothetical protein